MNKTDFMILFWMAGFIALAGFMMNFGISRERQRGYAAGYVDAMQHKINVVVNQEGVKSEKGD